MSDEIDLSGELLGSVDTPPPPKSSPPKRRNPGWYPDLAPTQEKIFNDATPTILVYGEKGGGKSVIGGHKMIRHAYENNDALVLVIAPSMRTGNEGIWHDLETLILPAWRDGIGLEYHEARLDPNTKDRHRWIKNMHGGWSKLLLMSIMYRSQVQARVKGPAPSMIYVDELTNCDGREYYTYPALQLGRRRGDSKTPQQYVATCNPEGPTHWVYQLFFVENKDNPRFAVYHVPFSENKYIDPAYLVSVMDILKNDPVEKRRLVDGEWVDRPTGEGLFKEYFNELIHVKGDIIRGEGLTPTPGFPIRIGYDLGQMFSSVTFTQLVKTSPTDGSPEKRIWKVFDEIDHLGEKILYRNLAQKIVARMQYWEDLKKSPFDYEHITDDSAINQWRPGEGSYDSWEFEKEFSKMGRGTVRMVACPKGKGSVSARVRMFQGKLFGEEIFISATCRNTISMVKSLEADEDDPETPKRSKWVHKFDSVTYPIFKMEAAPSRNFLQTGRVSPQLIHCGRT